MGFEKFGQPTDDADTTRSESSNDDKGGIGGCTITPIQQCAYEKRETVEVIELYQIGQFFFYLMGQAQICLGNGASEQEGGKLNAAS